MEIENVACPLHLLFNVLNVDSYLQNRNKNIQVKSFQKQKWSIIIFTI